MSNTIILVDRSNQNQKGESIKDFKAYFDKLLSLTSYVKASAIVRQEFNILIILGV